MGRDNRLKNRKKARQGRINMPNKPLRLCTYPGCNQLVSTGRCEKHAVNNDRHKESAYDRGYDYRWYKYSKWFLKQPENQFCKLGLQGCTSLADCVDHIVQPNSKDDPMFWNTNNHQAACIHCNSMKGHKTIKGEAKPFSMG